uniref:Uncharacterized protein n=1 Tax=Cajanus cajan TaxID=3821 RepID=A0A151U6E0_CAJCA|nr:hypothetical protein KK1_007521 [Cajanus cajan]
MDSNVSKLPISCGMVPINRLWDKFKDCNPMSIYISKGTFPNKLLLERSITFIKLTYSLSLPFISIVIVHAMGIENSAK